MDATRKTIPAPVFRLIFDGRAASGGVHSETILRSLGQL
jgi:hypothetical protein